MKHIIVVSILLIGLSSCLKHKTIKPVEVIVDSTAIPCGDTISFANIILPQVLTPNCNTSGCHDNSSAGGYDFTTYATVNAHAGKVLSTMQQNSGFIPMPLGASKLNDSLINKFDCWIQQGQLNN